MTGPRAVAVAVALLAVVGGCGYSWRGNLPPHLKTVGVPVFTNRTQWPNIESALTAAVANAFAADGRLKVVDPAHADAILEGEITNYQVTVLAYDSNANPQQYRLFVTVSIRFRDVQRGTLIFEDRGLQERVDYLAAPVVADTIARQDAAIGPVAQIIARDIVARAVDPF
jgi:outer membrane lipopolysaccharide assembly protein LptE/RlpB